MKVCRNLCGRLEGSIHKEANRKANSFHLCGWCHTSGSGCDRKGLLTSSRWLHSSFRNSCSNVSHTMFSTHPGASRFSSHGSLWSLGFSLPPSRDFSSCSLALTFAPRLTQFPTSYSFWLSWLIPHVRRLVFGPCNLSDRFSRQVPRPLERTWTMTKKAQVT